MAGLAAILAQLGMADADRAERLGAGLGGIGLGVTRGLDTRRRKNLLKDRIADFDQDDLSTAITGSPRDSAEQEDVEPVTISGAGRPLPARTSPDVGFAPMAFGGGDRPVISGPTELESELPPELGTEIGMAAGEAQPSLDISPIGGSAVAGPAFLRRTGLNTDGLIVPESAGDIIARRERENVVKNTIERQIRALDDEGLQDTIARGDTDPVTGEERTEDQVAASAGLNTSQDVTQQAIPPINITLGSQGDRLSDFFLDDRVVEALGPEGFAGAFAGSRGREEAQDRDAMIRFALAQMGAQARAEAAQDKLNASNVDFAGRQIAPTMGVQDQQQLDQLAALLRARSGGANNPVIEQLIQALKNSIQ